MAETELIPPGVRVALRNAVGGWGPYSVREIAELFNTHGFFERADDAPYSDGGQRRHEADVYHGKIDFSSPNHARRYLDLVDEVLENYPEGVEDPAVVGVRLRGALTRAGIKRGVSGRLELPNAQAEAEQSLDEATEGVWTEDRIRVFISHTSKHRAAVGDLASELNRFAFSCFVAHDAIEPSREWQDVIEAALRTADVFIAYVTPDFNGSQWTDQEVGWALGRGLIVLPLKVGADPYGFFGTYQALPVQQGQRAHDVAVGVTRAFAVAVFRGQRRRASSSLGNRMADVIVEAFCISGSFETARRRYELLRLIPSAMWEKARRDRVAQALGENTQLRHCTVKVGEDMEALPEVVRTLLDRAKGVR